MVGIQFVPLLVVGTGLNLISKVCTSMKYITVVSYLGIHKCVLMARVRKGVHVGGVRDHG